MKSTSALSLLLHALTPLLTPALMPLLILVLAGIWQHSHAAPLALRQSVGQYALTPAMQVFKDDSAALSFDQVRSSAQAHRFLPNHSTGVNFGFTTAAYWLHIRLKNQDDAPGEWFLENQYPILDYYDVFIVDAAQRVQLWRGGDRLPFSVRPLKHRNVIHRLSLLPGQEVDLYVRAASQGAVRLPLMLFGTSAMLEKEHAEQLATNTFFGILLAIFLYNSLLFLTLRNASYGYYLLYLGSFILYQLVACGLAFEYFWPDSPNWGNLSMLVFLCTAFLGGFQFARTFLQLARHARWLDYLCQLFCGLYLLLLGATFLCPYSLLIRIIAVLDLLSLLLLLLVGIVCFLRKVRQAKYFLLAWGVLIVAAIFDTLAAANWLPASFVVNHVLQMGGAVEVILLSFALADRMQMLKTENERILRQAAHTLEERVQVRTVKLEQANRELAEAIESLKTMQNDMIRVEKMAALGSLVGGIAHELNTPIGNSIMMGSTLLGEVRHMLDAAQSGALRPQTVVEQLHFMDDGVAVLMRNLQRAAELVASFKQVAVDRASNQSRLFDVRHTLEEIVLTLEPMYRDGPYRLELDLATDLHIDSFPGALGQIITNFVSNSLLHGFAGRAQGHMRLGTRVVDAQRIEIAFSDDGHGMEPADLKRVFEPFFTTRFGQGSSGLGMHIVYNLVTEMLCGEIRINSRVGGGTTIQMLLPRSLPG
jgi:signal transduction histidine kinase